MRSLHKSCSCSWDGAVEEKPQIPRASVRGGLTQSGYQEGVFKDGMAKLGSGGRGKGTRRRGGKMCPGQAVAPRGRVAGPSTVYGGGYRALWLEGRGDRMAR